MFGGDVLVIKPDRGLQTIHKEREWSKRERKNYRSGKEWVTNQVKNIGAANGTTNCYVGLIRMNKEMKNKGKSGGYLKEGRSTQLLGTNLFLRPAVQTAMSTIDGKTVAIGAIAT